MPHSLKVHLNRASAQRKAVNTEVTCCQAAAGRGERVEEATLSQPCDLWSFQETLNFSPYKPGHGNR